MLNSLLHFVLYFGLTEMSTVFPKYFYFLLELFSVLTYNLIILN
nr:MAG TPA: hypothetical protein [Caudoviricetes sp.]